MKRLNFLLTLVVPAFAMADETIPGYHWQQVVDGVYVHQQTDPLAGPVDGNSVIIDIGESVVVVDTHINPAAARAAIAMIQSELGDPVTYIVNTHWHDDHTNGNHAYREAFPDAKILSHQDTLRDLKKEWQAMEDGRKEAYAKVEPEQILAAADALEDPNQAIGYRLYAGYVAALKPELPTMELVYPDTVFDNSYVIDDGDRKIKLKWLGRGNTDGDIIVWLPEQKLVITGDMLVAPVPFAFDSPMVEWVATLDSLAESAAEIFIPGHGPVQYDRLYFDQVRDLLRTTVERVRKAQEDGVGFENLANAVDLDEQRILFTQSDAEKEFAWQSYYATPALKSAWVSLGYPLPPATEGDAGSP